MAALRLPHVWQARRAPHPAENVVARPGESHTTRPPPDNADTGREQTRAPPPPPPGWPSVGPTTTHHTTHSQSDIYISIELRGTAQLTGTEMS